MATPSAPSLPLSPSPSAMTLTMPTASSAAAVQPPSAMKGRKFKLNKELIKNIILFLLLASLIAYTLYYFFTNPCKRSKKRACNKVLHNYIIENNWELPPGSRQECEGCPTRGYRVQGDEEGQPLIQGYKHDRWHNFSNAEDAYKALKF